MTLPTLTRRKHPDTPLSSTVKKRLLLDHSVSVESMLEEREEKREGVTHHYDSAGTLVSARGPKGVAG